jgi:hypothetical protein
MEHTTRSGELGFSPSSGGSIQMEMNANTSVDSIEKGVS